MQTYMSIANEEIIGSVLCVAAVVVALSGAGAAVVVSGGVGAVVVR